MARLDVELIPALSDNYIYLLHEPQQGMTAVVDPGLKPNQPNQRINTPRPAMGILCPGMARALPSAVYLPKRGPTTSAPARAIQPPTECTTVEPAKSIKPMFSSQPLPNSPAPHRLPQHQCPEIG